LKGLIVSGTIKIFDENTVVSENDFELVVPKGVPDVAIDSLVRPLFHRLSETIISVRKEPLTDE
jgi:hypothetical protein